MIEVGDGHIISLLDRVDPNDATRLDGIVLPGLVNAHSHAFHRLLRGRTHRLGGDFWLWRERMYEVAAALTPEAYEGVATAVFIEMALAGVTTVGEFHYLHHQTGGVPYDDPNEMGHALIRAARRAGIRICLLDAGYFTAGFEDRPLHPAQQRFRDGSPDQWIDRVEELAASHGGDPDVVIGLAPHSVRAVPRDGLRRLAERRAPGKPVHIHVSEQPAENQECLEANSMTPTALLDATGLLGRGTTLVHATHVTDADVGLIGSSGSMVCYCATTERDLADGLGPAAALSAAGADLCVGSDSHAVVDLFEETRGIELHQRLLTGRRGTLSPESLMLAATVNGAASLGFPHRGLEPGASADFMVLDPTTPRLVGLDGSGSIDHLIFAATSSDVTDVFVGGRRIVAGGSHPGWAEARQALQPHLQVN
jgi:formiminoglutamate deiminase